MSLCEHSVDGDHSVSPEFLLNSTNTANMTSADCLMENADEVVLSAPTDSEHVSHVNCATAAVFCNSLIYVLCFINVMLPG